MKAFVYTKYGLPDVMQLKEVEKPITQEGEVLVKIHAASVNFSDWALVRGKPFALRLMSGGALKPKYRILGADIAGRVEAVGGGVKQFQPGDEVYADLSDCGWGGFAEYAAVPEHALALKPSNLTYKEAAAVPQAAVVALQGLRNEGCLQPGAKVLIHGASGGIGTFALQIAKYFGGEVTAVCSTRNVDLVLSIGADHVVDYTKQDFTQNSQQYDLIFDIKANRSLSEIERVLSANGKYILVGGEFTRILQASLANKYNMVNLSVEISQADLDFIRGLIETRKVVPIIDRSYPFSEVPEAVRYYGAGHSQGKVVVAHA